MLMRAPAEDCASSKEMMMQGRPRARMLSLAEKIKQAEETKLVAQAATDAEKRARDEKTARLRALRLSKDKKD